MSYDSYTRTRPYVRRDGRSTVERLRRYLASRSRETWLFFMAGVLLGALLG